MPDQPSPSIPPIATSDLPGTGGAIGPEPEDFLVDEIPLYTFSGEGEHLYVRVRKRLKTTREAQAAIARAAGVPESEIGTAGMKDKHAVTTQWMSLPARRAKPLAEWQVPDGVQILESSRHGNKLRTGHLKGNTFRIRIVDTGPDVESRGAAIAARLRERGLPNYFGAQRFGRDNRNLADAIAWLQAEARGDRKRPPPFERKLFASVAQSEVFNRYVTARIERGLEHPLEGEVVRLEGTGSMFAIEAPEREISRWACNDIHPTGPMIGPKMRKAHGAALDLEESAVASVGLTPEIIAALGRYADGTRRDVLVRLPSLSVEAEPSGNALVVELTLPSGGYATQAIREFSREPFFRYTP